jgi:hypothetical protein
MAPEIAPEWSLETAFKAPLKPDAPFLTGRANWNAWSQAIKKCLNEKNLYFALHEQAPYELESVPRADGLRGNPLVRTWVVQTQDEEVMSAAPKVQRRKYAKGLRNDVRELARADKAAMKIILERLDEAVRKKIPPGTFTGSVKDLWAKLEWMHMDATIEDVDTAIANLEGFSQNQRLSLEDRAAEMTTVRDDLASWGVELPDAYLIVLFVRGLDQAAEQDLVESSKALGCCSWDKFKAGFSSKDPAEDGEDGRPEAASESENSSMFFSEIST